MRTKTLLLTAVLSAAGIATSLAQGTVDSVNAVGYVNQACAIAGFYIISNPLNSGNNAISSVIRDGPDGAIVYRFSSTGGFDTDPPNYIAGSGWFTSKGAATTVLAPGEAFFVQIPSGATLPVTMTFVGEVPQGTSLSNPVTLKAGTFSLLASQVPLSAKLSDPLMNFPAADGDTIYFYRNGSYSNPAYSFVQGAGWFQGATAADPTPGVGEGFFLFSGATTDRTWTRSFSVNP